MLTKMLRGVLAIAFMVSAIIVGLMLTEYHALHQGIALRLHIVEVASLVFLAVVVIVFTYREVKRESPFLLLRALVAPLTLTLTAAMLVGLFSYLYVATLNRNYSDFMTEKSMSQLPSDATGGESVATHLSGQMYYSPLGQFVAKFFSLLITGGVATIATVIFTGIQRNRLTRASTRPK
jgi:hypothetical protein